MKINRVVRACVLVLVAGGLVVALTGCCGGGVAYGGRGGGHGGRYECGPRFHGHGHYR